MKKSFRSFLAFILLFFFNLISPAQDSLNIVSQEKVGQIEVGGPFVGIEIHNSFPAINRISFYYPVANSIDISTDYWKRENYRVMSFGIKAGDLPKRILEPSIYEVNLTPYSSSFIINYDDFEINIKYQFCKTKPAMVAFYRITNKSHSKLNYEFYTRLEGILRTSHSYNVIDKANTGYDSKHGTIRMNYENIEAGNSSLFIANAGLKPSSFTASKIQDENSSSLDDYWLAAADHLPEEVIDKKMTAVPEAAFLYEKNLAPNESFLVIQIIGSAKIEETEEIIQYLLDNYEEEINQYEDYILDNSIDKNIIETGIENFDFTTDWAQAILKTNAHYIDGTIQPMPAQAEYNFYFTHDALLTDLAAVNFDLERVKQDLKFIIEHSDSDKIIPHAFYWKDSSYKTEYAGTENWNHFWFIMVSARYYRHANDKEFLSQLYPFINKSVETALKNMGDDYLMYSFRPDWWDIGNNFGPRAYMTILAVKALREYVYISAQLNQKDSLLKYYDKLADSLNSNLIKKLWDDSLKYLISYFEDGSIDKHIYMGSMLAAHFDLLNEKREKELIKTAEKYLLDEKLGIYTLFPMDLDQLGDYMGFTGNEAGEPYYYANGGIWPHGNAWFALGLIKTGQYKKGYNFIKNTMTMSGIMNSPNGQPAMYEYRISDKNNPSVYGKIDKPEFLWAGGWYIYTLYNLLGLRENTWNISLEPYNPLEKNNTKFNFLYKNSAVSVSTAPDTNTYPQFIYNDQILPTAVIPEDLENLDSVQIKFDTSGIPYIKQVNAKLIEPFYLEKENSLSFWLESFIGNRINLEFISSTKPKRISIDEQEIDFKSNKEDNYYITIINSKTVSKKERFRIIF